MHSPDRDDIPFIPLNSGSQLPLNPIKGPRKPEEFTWESVEGVMVTHPRISNSHKRKIEGVLRNSKGKFYNFICWDQEKTRELFERIRVHAKKDEEFFIRGFYDLKKDPDKQWLNVREFEPKIKRKAAKWRVKDDIRDCEAVTVGGVRYRRIDFILDELTPKVVCERLRSLSAVDEGAVGAAQKVIGNKSYAAKAKNCLAQLLEEALNLKQERDSRDYHRAISEGVDVEKYF